MTNKIENAVKLAIRQEAYLMGNSVVPFDEATEEKNTPMETHNTKEYCFQIQCATGSII